MRQTRGVLRAPILIAFALVALVSGTVGAAWIERGTFNPLALMARHIARIEAAGLDIALELVPGGVRLGGKPLGASGGGTLPAWRIDEAALVDASVAARTDKGQLRATLSSTL